jgi:hypothetical protein
MARAAGISKIGINFSSSQGHKQWAEMVLHDLREHITFIEGF